MPKRRMHDGSMWENPKFARLTIRQRLLFCALIDAADDQGRMVADPALVRSKAFPFDDVALNDVADDVMALGGNGSILVYSNTNGDPILQITNWWKYQSPQWACPSSLPPPPGWQDRIRHRIGKDIIIKNWGGHEEPSASPVPELVQSVNKVHDESVQSTELVGTESVQCSSYGYGNDYGNVHDDAHAPLDPKAAITGTVFASWQNARGGATTALDCEQIGMLCDEYSPEWVLEAIKEANLSKQDKLPSLKFLDVILQRWKREGFKTPFDAKAQREKMLVVDLKKKEAEKYAEKKRLYELAHTPVVP